MQNAINATTGKAYTNGNNAALCELAGRYTCNEWATYRQWQGAGYQVKKGSRGVRLVKVVEVDVRTKAGKGRKETRPRRFVVFNRDQVEAIAG